MINDNKIVDRSQGMQLKENKIKEKIKQNSKIIRQFGCWEIKKIGQEILLVSNFFLIRKPQKTKRFNKVSPIESYAIVDYIENP